jgi:hypothetical protein
MIAGCLRRTLLEVPSPMNSTLGYTAGKMTPIRYENLNGNSGVTHYAIEPGLIAVQFKDGTIYIYDQVRPGATHIDQMKVLAIAGRGLGTYVSQNVKHSYARKQYSW